MIIWPRLKSFFAFVFVAFLCSPKHKLKRRKNTLQMRLQIFCFPLDKNAQKLAPRKILNKMNKWIKLSCFLQAIIVLWKRRDNTEEKKKKKKTSKTFLLCNCNNCNSCAFQMSRAIVDAVRWRLRFKFMFFLLFRHFLLVTLTAETKLFRGKNATLCVNWIAKSFLQENATNKNISSSFLIQMKAKFEKWKFKVLQ